MNNLIYSLSASLGAEVYSTKGEPLAVLHDIIGNKDSGKVTYFILCPQEQSQGKGGAAESFAIHHSYFYFSSDNRLTFSPKLGNQDYSFFLDLPEQYDDTDVSDLADFKRYLTSHSVIAGHRSDND